MEDWNIFLQLMLAFGVGLLIGIERGWHLRALAPGTRVAGIRTFTLVGFLGGIIAYLSTILGPWMLLISCGGIFLLVLGIYYHDLAKTPHKGATTEIAILLTFFLGVLAIMAEPILVIAMTMVVITVLRLKAPAHDLLERLNKKEISAFFELVILTVLILPLVPNRGFGPGEMLNPFEIWLMVVFIQGISFFGHFSIRLWGERVGTLLMGVFGGLASTTALTMTAATLSRKKGADQDMLASAIAASNVVMFFRTLAIIGIINFKLVSVMALPLVFGAVGAALAAIIFQKKAVKSLSRTRAARKAFTPGPTNLLVAFGFAAFLAAVLLLTYYAKLFLADGGVIALAAISGIMDVDAINISLSKMADEEGLETLGSIMTVGIFMALFTNSIWKTAISFKFGNKALGRRVAVVFLLATAGVVLGASLVLLS